MNRYKLFESENQFISLIRDNELLNPAPFSSDILLDFSQTQVEQVHPLEIKNHERNNFIESVPIQSIVGIDNTNNLDNYEKGMTFREVLLECLHGESLIKESLDYFIGEDVKSDYDSDHPQYREFPQNPQWKGTSAFGRSGVGVTKRGDVYYIDQGKQRSIMAMFGIFQNSGINGLYKNIRVERYA